MPNGKRRARPHLDPHRPPTRREIKIYLPPDLLAAVEEEAQRAGLSRSAWIEKALSDAIYEGEEP